MYPRLALGLCACALATAVLAGCNGGTSLNESGKGSAAQANEEVQASAGPSTRAYADAVKENVGAVLDSLESLQGATTVDELVRGVDEAHTAAKDAEDKLVAISVPPGATEANGMLVSGLDSLSTNLEQLGRFLDQARSGELGSLDTLVESMEQLKTPEDASILQEALSQLEASGVDVSGLAQPG